MKQSEPCIGCIVGTGAMPILLIKQLEKQKKKFVVVYVNRKSCASVAPSIFVNSGEIGKILDFLKKSQVKDIVFAGKINRPSLRSIKLGKSGLMFFAGIGLKALEVLRGGDDRIVSNVIHALCEAGYRVVAPETFVQELLMPQGIISRNKPSTQDVRDVLIGRQILASLGGFDVGQAVVVADGRVLGIEAAEGTDQLLARCAKLKDRERGSGVLVKMKKSHQEIKTDLPAIGVQTILNAHKAGLNGIALSANTSLIIDIKKVVKAADKSKMFLEGVL